MRGVGPQHSPWLREGLANTLLMIAAIGEKSGLVSRSTLHMRRVHRHCALALRARRAWITAALPLGRCRSQQLPGRRRHSVAIV
jgi:hypothetical protein